MNRVQVTRGQAGFIQWAQGKGHHDLLDCKVNLCRQNVCKSTIKCCKDKITDNVCSTTLQRAFDSETESYDGSDNESDQNPGSEVNHESEHESPNSPENMDVVPAEEEPINYHVRNRYRSRSRSMESIRSNFSNLDDMGFLPSSVENDILNQHLPNIPMDPNFKANGKGHVIKFCVRMENNDWSSMCHKCHMCSYILDNDHVPSDLEPEYYQHSPQCDPCHVCYKYMWEHIQWRMFEEYFSKYRYFPITLIFYNFVHIYNICFLLQ